MQAEVLSHSFFDRPVLKVCKDLLGKFLVISDPLNPPLRGTSTISPLGGGTKGGQAFMITEIEAYDGMDDQACHARCGKTERNAPMWGKSGHRYIYLCYGMYWMLNIVTGPGNHPSAALIRAVTCDEGIVTSTNKKSLDTCNSKLVTDLNGPGKLTKYLGITKEFNERPSNKKTGLWIEDRGVIVTSYKQKPRIGIEYAGERKDRHWRFIIDELLSPIPSLK